MTATATALELGGQAALLLQPPRARWLYLFGHGAGAGIEHPFMESMAQRLAAREIATLRWELTYMTQRRRRPDPATTCEREARAVAVDAAARFGELRIVAGGKSMGGRMTSQAHAAEPLPRVEALAFLGFPLHPAGQPAITRAAHLAKIAEPLLLVQGSRDKLAEPTLLAQVISQLPRATLRVIEDADHGLDVPKTRMREHPHEIAAGALADWLARLDT
ncbi:MAG: alpha/beta family hydrolase [Kofleriaceae bacterium]